MPKTKFCVGLSDISDSYMGCIIDDWGVLHDGEDAFPEAVDTLKSLKERHKHIIILSNDRKTALQKKEQLKKMKIGPSLYQEIVTPIEVVRNGLIAQDKDFFKDIGEKAFLFTHDGDTSILDDTGVEAVEDINDADFVIMMGMAYPRRSLESYEEEIKVAIKKRLTAICLNQDSRGLIGTNFLVGPALIARRYEDSGGIVNYVGKPHSYIYRHCVELFQEKEIYPAHTVMFGDTMAHDVIGANTMGIDTCLFKSGLHAANFMHCDNLKEVDNALKNLIVQYNNVMPTYLANEMAWGNALPDRKHKKRKLPKRPKSKT